MRQKTIAGLDMWRPVGILETAIKQLKAEAWHKQMDGTLARYVTLRSVARFNLKLQLAKFDSHTIIAGTNGVGKSYAQIAMIKTQLEIMSQPTNFIQADTEGKLKFLYAYHTRKNFIDEIKKHHNCVFGIDELRVFFDYKRSFIREQNELYNTIEVARSHQNAYIGCTRDLNKIDNNYRNAKAAILIRLWDKVMKNETDTDFVYGSVFVGNPAVEMEDKFMQNMMLGSNSIERSLWIAEHLPTFVGSIIIKDIHSYGVTAEDIRIYEEQKVKGIKNYSNIYERRDYGRTEDRKHRKKEAV